MKIVFYTIECLTNLHVGSGEINYNIVDSEVEKDAVTGLPVIHASGIKGALKEALLTSSRYRAEEIDKIFGTEGDGDRGHSGTHKFLDANLISRPMRVSGSVEVSSVAVVTIDSVNRFLKKMKAFGVTVEGVSEITTPDFKDKTFLTSAKEDIQIEGEPTGQLEGVTLDQLKRFEKIAFTSPFAVARSFEDYDLPVMARNCLVKGRENLWYEEVIPHGSVLYFAVLYPEGAQELEFPEVVQFGGNASIGCGFAKMTKISETTESGQHE